MKMNEVIASPDVVGPNSPVTARKLSARIEPFDSYWQAPKDVEKGYKSFYQY